jgi:3-oxo-5-alpha-steroid 4-dehydrogenase 1
MYIFCYGSDEWLYDPRFCIGIVIFLTGAALNIQADNILINLRKETSSSASTSGKPGATNATTSSEVKRYKIPYGGLFEYVSGANFGNICINICMLIY